MIGSTALVVVAIIVGVVFVIIAQIERRAKYEGGLFTRSPSTVMRVFAILLGLVFSAMFIFELMTSDAFHILWLIVGLALIAHGLGAGQLLSKLQSGQAASHTPITTLDKDSPGLKRLVRLLLILVLGIAGILDVFY